MLLDNLYCNGQVSRDGHPWSTMAYNTDYIARDWHLTYSSREGVDDDDDGNLAKAPSGYIWDACARHGLTYRSYGEYGRRVSHPTAPHDRRDACPAWSVTCRPTLAFRSRRSGQPVRDTDKVDMFLKEFREFEKDGNLPASS